MADEQTPPKRDVNESFTLDAFDSTSDPDGPLSHLLSSSPVADLGRLWTEPTADDPSAATAPANGGERSVRPDGLPGLADVSGLEDLYTKTTEVPFGDPAAEPPPPTYTPPWAEPVAFRPVDPRPTEPLPVEPPPTDPAATDSEPVDARRVDPQPVRLDPAVGPDPFRSFEVGGNLRFSTEAGVGSAVNWSRSRHDQQYPAALVPNAVPAPVAPSRSVRVPGEERRRGALPTALIEITERRWFWASTAGFFSVLVLGLLAVGNIVPNPLATDRAGVVADSRLPAAPVIDGSTDTSEAETSSSTGAGSGLLDPDDSTTSVESTTSSTATTARRRVATTAPPTVRSTTTPTSSPTSASSTTSTRVSSTTSTTATSSTSTTAASSSTTAGSSSTTSTTASTTTDTTPTTASTTESTEGSTTTTSGSTSSTG